MIKSALNETKERLTKERVTETIAIRPLGKEMLFVRFISYGIIQWLIAPVSIRIVPLVHPLKFQLKLPAASSKNLIADGNFQTCRRYSATKYAVKNV